MIVFVLFKDLPDDEVLRKTQFGLLFSKPKYGIFVTAFYKEGFPVDDPVTKKAILDAVREVVNRALELDKETGNGKEDRRPGGYFE